MSYNPNSNYGYPTPPNYYMEDTEEFVQDFTDSETSERHQALQTSHPNVTEIYSRNNIAMAQRPPMVQQMGYHQNQNHYAQQCYYENHPPQATRHLTAVPIQNYGQYDPRIHQYCPLATSSLHDTAYESSAFRNAQNNVNGTVGPTIIPRTYQEGPIPVQKQSIKRYPIKVGTPKYYRKAPSSAVYKRPSALCLPVASQPDPAAHRKHKKPSTDVQYTYTQNLPLANDPTNPQLLGKTSNPTVTDHKVGSEGDFNLKVSKLDDMFAQIEKGSELPKAKTKADIAKIAKFLRPRVPSSIREKQEKARLKAAKSETAEGGANNAEGKDAKASEQNANESPGDSIERLLNQLKKCELTMCGDDLDKPQQKNDDHSARTDKTNQKTRKQMPPIRSPSFNYQDITTHMTKSKCEMKTFEPDGDNERSHSIHEIARPINLSMSASRSFISKPSLDDHCALELHRSKSYIVNLIDRALSKELGTVPNSRTHKEFNDMSPRKAIDMMNRHSCGKFDKALNLEITAALTNSILSNDTLPEGPDIDHIPSSSSSSKGKVCCCNAEEPTYIKQLKQLRWGHLKHIQREVRRLEDLERFLDSCSLNPISEI